MDSKRWAYGETVVMRYPPEERMLKAYLARTGSLTPNVAGLPHIVLEDSERLLALYLPEGTPVWRWNVAEGRFRQPRITQGDSVRLLFPGLPYEVTMFYETGSGPAPWVQSYFPAGKGRFYGWKVDITSPFYRTEVGFDVIDEVLDIIVDAERSFRWKDEDEMADLVSKGVYAREEAARLREIGTSVIKMIDGRQYPFDGSWLDWRPDSGLELGPLPSGWQFLPVPAPHRPYQGQLAGPTVQPRQDKWTSC
jgi:hypothetical protein